VLYVTRLDRQTFLGNALRDIGFELGSRVAVPRFPGIPEPGASWAMETYRELGGIQALPQLRPNGWDIVLADGLIVELDEEQHFNRYRAATLGLGWASTLPWREDYLRMCAQFEVAAVAKNSGGGFWEKPGAVAQFGPAGSRKDLDGAGSPRWKQRAVYDALRDIAAAAGIVTLARLSVYDVVGDAVLGDVLVGRAPLDGPALAELMARRTINPQFARTPQTTTAGQGDSAHSASPTQPGASSFSVAQHGIEVSQLAQQIGRSPKTLRAALRQRYGKLVSGDRWILDEDQVAYLTARFAS
jgi:hypothetical protein